MFSMLAVVLTTQIGLMSLDDKVQTLFVVPACPMRKDEAHVEAIRKLKPGGILFKQSQTPWDHLNFLDRLKFDGIRCADAEWGLSMRIKEDVIHWPRNMTLGAIQDNCMLSLFGFYVGLECRSAGIDVNFAPVIDGPGNPSIGMRSFGRDAARKACVVMQAMQHQGTVAAVKHYPNLQDSRIDPHYALPVIDRLDLESFKILIDAGARCIMTTHVMFQDKIVTFSPDLVGKIIRQDLGAKDIIIITDAMNMKALPDTPGENAVKALEAGHDLLLYGSHIDEIVDDILYRQVPEAHKAIKEAVLNGRISVEALDEHVTRILNFRASLHHDEPFPEPSFLTSPRAQAFKYRLFQEAVTLVGSLPPKEAEVVSVTQVTSEVKEKLAKLREEKIPYVVVLYTSPYALLELGTHDHILVAYEDQPEAYAVVQQILSGKLMPKGVLPIDVVPAAELASQ